MLPGYLLLSPFRYNDSNDSTSLNLILLDEKGYLVIYQPTNKHRVYDFRFSPENKQFSYIATRDQVLSYHVTSQSFQPVDSFSNSPNMGGDVHELQILPGGHYLVGGYQVDTFDLSQEFYQGEPGAAKTPVKGFAFEVLDKNHEQLFHWESNDHILPTESYSFYGYNPEFFNNVHGNSIDVDREGNYLLSFRHLNAIYKIDGKSGKILWKLGGKSSDFSFANDTGFSAQHDARFHGGGVISLFDNGNMNTPPASRAIVYQLDTIRSEATKIWEYTGPCTTFSYAMGNHQLLDKGHHLINFGTSQPSDPNVVIVNRHGKLISSLQFEYGVTSYRTYFFRLKLPFKRPRIHKKKVPQGYLLSAPKNHHSYIWSTGEKTRNIFVKESGEYQVWVSEREVMVGSYPISISNPP